MEENNLQLERTVFFCDAVVAIAITILALKIKIEHKEGHLEFIDIEGVHREPSIEPCFAPLKSIFDLEHEQSLPYKGFIWVEPYLWITVLTLQLMMMYDKWENQRNLGYSQYWNAIFE